MIQSKIASIFHHLMNQFISHILRPIFCNFIDKLEFTIILSWKPSAFFGYLEPLYLDAEMGWIKMDVNFCGLMVPVRLKIRKIIECVLKMLVFGK